MRFQRLQDLRIDHDMTQQEVADYLKCHRNVYSRYELGNRMIPIDLMIKLADLYGVSLDYLTGRTDKNE